MSESARNRSAPASDTERSLRVLLIEDNADEVRRIESTLQDAGFHPALTVVETEDRLLDALRTPHDIVLSEFALPHLTALRALELCRALGSPIPVLILSGFVGEEVIIESFKAGISDFVHKDRLARLGQTVSRTLELSQTRQQKQQAEEQLHLYRRVIEASLQGMIIVDARAPDFPILYVNPAFTRMTGYSAAEAVGRNCRFLQCPQTDRATVARIREAVRTGSSISTEILNARKDGTRFWNALSISPVGDEHGLLTHFVGIQIDITEKKSLEKQLLQAQKMEAIGRLAGGVAHDFNNLLTIILGYSDVLLGAGSATGAGMLVQQIRQAGEQAAVLTRQLLLFSRQQDAQPEVFDLNGIVRNLQKMLQRIIGEDYPVRTELADIPCPILADPGQIEQAIMNLVVNARDAMPGGGEVLIRTAQNPAGEIRLVVKDGGCGMTAEVKEHIFEPFFTTKEADKGTGLGLAIVFGVVKRAKGSIHVESEPGRGTTFEILLPRAPLPDSTRDRVRETPLPRGSERLLLVEDDDMVRRFARTALELAGYAVTEAASGPEALKIVETMSPPPQMLITDVVMPDMSGRQLAEELRRRFPQLPVLLVSGFTDEALVRYGVSLGTVPFLHKPFTTVSLARKVREVLDAPPPNRTG